MVVEEIKVVRSVMWHGLRYSSHYDEKADALMVPTIIGSGMHMQALYLKIPGEEIRKCLKYKEDKNGSEV